MKKLLQFVKISMFIWGSFTFGMVVGTVVHELGHALAMWLTGGRVANIVINPLSWSYVKYGTEPVFPRLTASAGVLSEILTGIFVLVSIWKKKTPYLTPFALLGALSFLHPSVYFLADFFFFGVGDAYTLYEYGIPRLYILLACLVLFTVGSISFYFAVPRMGIRSEDTLARRVALFTAGIIPFFLIAMARAFFFANEIFFFLLLLMPPLEIFIILIACISRKLQHQADDSLIVEWKHAVVVFLLGFVTLATPYLL